jgi:CheY-like chemotaxis protein/HPt (histidine-containing phosphotransfer) domain-containing protein
MTPVPPSSSGPLAKVPPGLRVLLADDSETTRQVAVFLLQELGCIVDAVENGREAVEAAGRSVYDLVLLDCDMPVMDGYAAAREIRTRSGNAVGPKIIALTASAVVGEREICIASGMDGHLAKPYEMRQLAALLRELRPSALQSARDQEPPVSAEAITAIRKQLGVGAEQMFGHLVSMFQREGEGCIQKMGTVAACDDLQMLARNAHRLRGVSSNFGAKKLIELCTGFESQLGASECTNVAEHVTGIQEEFTRVIAALKELG